MGNLIIKHRGEQITIPPPPPKRSFKNCINWGDPLGLWLEKQAGTKKGAIGRFVRGILFAHMQGYITTVIDGQSVSIGSSKDRTNEPKKGLNEDKKIIGLQQYDLGEEFNKSFKEELKEMISKFEERKPKPEPVEIEVMKEERASIREVMMERLNQ